MDLAGWDKAWRLLYAQVEPQAKEALLEVRRDSFWAIVSKFVKPNKYWEAECGWLVNRLRM